MTAQAENQIRQAIQSLDADVFYVSARIDPNTVQRLRDALPSEPRERGVLVLTTYGGYAESAYIIARLFRRIYGEFNVCVFGPCKSAGTLLALGATQLVMGERGELGPLDVQLSEKDELARSGSGLEIFTSLNVLTETAFRAFETFLFETVRRSGGNITTRTAAKIATELTIGIVAPMAEQIDPVRLGHEQRAMSIASRYAERLGVREVAIQQLTLGYPSHEFVIDREEAEKLLENVREPNEAEGLLEDLLAGSEVGLYLPTVKHPPIVTCLSAPEEPMASDSPRPDDEESDDILGDPRSTDTETAERDSGDGTAIDQPG